MIYVATAPVAHPSGAQSPGKDLYDVSYRLQPCGYSPMPHTFLVNTFALIVPAPSTRQYDNTPDDGVYSLLEEECETVDFSPESAIR